jgi:hypothetical protein
VTPAITLRESTGGVITPSRNLLPVGIVRGGSFHFRKQASYPPWMVIRFKHLLGCSPSGEMIPSACGSGGPTIRVNTLHEVVGTHPQHRVSFLQ